MVVPSLSPSGSVLAAASYVNEAWSIPVTVNVFVARRFLTRGLPNLHLPELSVVQVPFRVPPPVH